MEPDRSVKTTAETFCVVSVTVSPACRAAARVLCTPRARSTCPVFSACSVDCGLAITLMTTFFQCTADGS